MAVVRFMSKDKKFKSQANSWQEQDNIFLHRSQVYVGLRLLYFGRLNHGEIWTIKQIKHYEKNHKVSYIQHVETMKDEIILVNERNEIHQMTFGYMSYSALWRIAE